MTDGTARQAASRDRGGTVVVVRVLDVAAGAEAARWARRLGVPLEPVPLEPAPLGAAGRGATEPSPPPPALALEVGRDGLGLRPYGGPRVRVTIGGTLARRGRGRDPLLRAVGRLEPGAHVVDATAGLGADAVRLAAAGLRVTMLERVPLVAALLEDALARARHGLEGAPAREVAARLELRLGDARTLLATLVPAPEVIVIDPMFPARDKRSLPKKGMALFRSLVGGDVDAAELLAAALPVARARVVVKRPRRGAALGGEGAPAPSGSVVGTTTRYDIYAPLRGGS